MFRVSNGRIKRGAPNALLFFDFLASLQAESISLQPHAPAKELNNFRAFRLAHVHQAHRAHAPAIPALGELLRADQDVDLAVPTAQIVEE